SDLVLRMEAAHPGRRAALNSWLNELQTTLSTTGMRFSNGRIVGGQIAKGGRPSGRSVKAGSLDERRIGQLEGANMANELRPVRTVILCAIPAEYEAAQAYFPPEDRLLGKGNIGYKSRDALGESVVVIRIQSMGNISAALETQQAIDVWSP